MAKTLGQILRSARESAKLTRPQLAKRLQITPGYLAHIENDAHVHVSERVLGNYTKAIRFRSKSPAVVRLAARQNKKATDWYRAYAKRRAAQKKSR